MAKIVVDSPDQEANVLQVLAQREQKALKAYAALIIRRELKRWGLLPRENEGGLSETNCSEEEKKIQRRGDVISITKLPFENLQMIMRAADPILLIKGDA
jgi:hypothetical protein